MHIAELVAQELLRQGFTEKPSSVFSKVVSTSGEFGRECITLRIDDGGRWLERVDGWGKVEKDVDLRNFLKEPQAAIRIALT